MFRIFNYDDFRCFTAFEAVLVLSKVRMWSWGKEKLLELGNLGIAI